MKIGTMFKDVFESFFSKPATQVYPAEKVITSERFRGKLIYNPALCTGCTLCVKDCPSNAIELAILDRAAKRYVMTYHLDQCVYCGQCVSNCKVKSLHMSNQEWELASVKKEAFEVFYGNPNDIKTMLEKAAQPNAKPGAEPAGG